MPAAIEVRKVPIHSVADASELAMRLRAFIEAQPGIARAVIAGELRRGCETVSSIIVLAQLEEDASPDALNAGASPGLGNPDRPALCAQNADSRGFYLSACLSWCPTLRIDALETHGRRT